MAKRGRKPSAEPKGYFYEREEKAVVDYLNSEDDNERNKIYNEILKPAFAKMIESIIRRYKLYIPDEEFEQTYDDTFSFLLTKINCFNPNKNFKAYSYCGTICKNYLIHKVNTFNKNLKRNIPFDNVVKEFDNDLKYSTLEEEKTMFISDLMEKTIQNIKDILDGKTNVSINANERKVGEALILLLDNWEDVMSTDGSAKLNKSAVLFFLRDKTDLSTKELRDNMRKFKIGYYNTKKSLLE